MKRFLVVLCLFGVLWCQAAEPEEVVEENKTAENPEPEAAPTGPQLLESVHLLSQVSQPHPNVKFTILFPEYFGKDATKTLLEASFKQGETHRVLIGVQNLDESMPIRITNVTGAFISEEGEVENYIQNFTIENPDVYDLNHKETLSIAYEFFPFTSFAPGTYKLVLTVFY